MTVRANKPAFNVREKLKSLDYSHVPYEKMPPGSVVNIAYGYNSAHSATTNQNYTVVGPVTLNRSDKVNKVWLYTNIQYYHTNANGSFSFQVSFDGGSNWEQLFYFHGEDDPPWTSAYSTRTASASFLYEPTGGLFDCMSPVFRTQFNHVNQNGGTLYLNRSLSGVDATVWRGSCTLTVMEIKG